MDLALKHDAIIVSPDHRLAPEATAEDALDDISDLWHWIGAKLEATIQQACSGLVIQTALSFYDPVLSTTTSTSPTIRAVIAQYPSVAWRTPHWSDKYEKNLFGVPQFPESVVDDFLASIAAEKEKSGKQPVISNGSLFGPTGEFSNRGLLAFSSQQNGRYLQIVGPERSTSPGKRRVHVEDRIEDGGILPPIAFVQGADDTVTPAALCEKFIEHVRKFKAVNGLAQGADESEVLKYWKEPGEHLFDLEVNLSENSDPWVKEVAAFAEGHWLK